MVSCPAPVMLNCEADISSFTLVYYEDKPSAAAEDEVSDEADEADTITNDHIDSRGRLPVVSSVIACFGTLLAAVGLRSSN